MILSNVGLRITLYSQTTSTAFCQMARQIYFRFDSLKSRAYALWLLTFGGSTVHPATSIEQKRRRKFQYFDLIVDIRRSNFFLPPRSQIFTISRQFLRWASASAAAAWIYAASIAAGLRQINAKCAGCKSYLSTLAFDFFLPVGSSRQAAVPLIFIRIFFHTNFEFGWAKIKNVRKSEAIPCVFNVEKQKVRRTWLIQTLNFFSAWGQLQIRKF